MTSFKITDLNALAAFDNGRYVETVIKPKNSMIKLAIKLGLELPGVESGKGFVSHGPLPQTMDTAPFTDGPKGSTVRAGDVKRFPGEHAPVDE